MRALAARGETLRCSETGAAPAWQGATREQIGAFMTEEQRRPGGMQRPSNAAGLVPGAARWYQTTPNSMRSGPRRDASRPRRVTSCASEVPPLQLGTDPSLRWLAARGETPRCTETGAAPGWPGATREQIGAFMTEEQRRPGGMQRPSNAAGLLPRAAGAGRRDAAPRRGSGAPATSGRLAGDRCARAVGVEGGGQLRRDGARVLVLDLVALHHVDELSAPQQRDRRR